MENFVEKGFQAAEFGPTEISQAAKIFGNILGGRKLWKNTLGGRTWAAKNYGKTNFRRQISGGRYSGLQNFGCQTRKHKKAAKKIGNLGGGPGGRKKAAENFGIF